MERGCSRRAFLALPPLLLNAAETQLPSEARRFRDGATEFDLVRLTSPEHSNYLPQPHLRSISVKNNFLLYCSDRTGSLQAFRIDLKSGENRLVSEAASLDPATLTLMPDERAIVFCDGPSLVRNGKTVYETSWDRMPGMGLSDDGQHATLIESRNGKYRLRIVPLSRGPASTVVEADSAMADPMPRPRRAGILYRRDDALWVVNYDAQQNRRLKIPAGSTAGPALWAPDGRTVLYLAFPDDPRRLIEMREHTPDTGEDKRIAQTSQFVRFTRNSDGTAFVGVSRNKPSPHILALLRVTRRELTLCEHRASDPDKVVVALSPTNQRLFFQTDREGKPAIYSIVLEKFLEKTDT